VVVEEEEQQVEQLPIPLVQLEEAGPSLPRKLHQQGASRSSLKGRDLIGQRSLLRTTILLVNSCQ
jgi:hypothetical protein